MNAVKVDAAKRNRLPLLRPGDYCEPEYVGLEENMLRRVAERKRKVWRSKAEALGAIDRSRLKFTASWDELRLLATTAATLLHLGRHASHSGNA